MGTGTILYVGGFQLPDKNAAALRVIANAKALREIGYNVIFINALIDTDIDKQRKVKYEGFECYEYQRERQLKYLFDSKNTILNIKRTNADIIIAYNYPAIALNRIRKYCKRYGVKCYADVTEWYIPVGNPVFRIIKGLDTEIRMRYVHPKMDGVIVISEYLYQYYKKKIKTVKIPPMVDLDENKWREGDNKKHKGIKLIYAGSPSIQKERLDLIINAIDLADTSEKVYLDVIGITKEQYNSMYRCQYNGKRVTFQGRISNSEVIKKTKEADWTVLLREKNKVVQAGFPTKISESISCGTPIIANRFSDIEDYLDENNSILIDTVEEIKTVFTKLKKKSYKQVNQYLFDYRGYLDQIRKFIE